MAFRAALDYVLSVDYAEGAMISASDVRGDSEMFSPANLLDEDYDS